LKIEYGILSANLGHKDAKNRFSQKVDFLLLAYVGIFEVLAAVTLAVRA